MAEGPLKRKKVTAIVKRAAGLSPSLLGDIRSLIEITRSRVATTINSELVLLYWQIGTRIRQDILQNQRAEYGEQIVSALGRQLHEEFGPGFSEKVLRHMIRFAEVCHASFSTIRKFFRDVLKLTISRGQLMKVINKGAAAMAGAFPRPNFRFARLTG